MIDRINQLRAGVKPAERVDVFGWRGIGKESDEQGDAAMEQFLSSEQCRVIGYGEHVYPLQWAIPLSNPRLGFTGGEVAVRNRSPRVHAKHAIMQA